VSDAVRRPCSDFMDMLRRLINYRIIIIIIKMFDVGDRDLPVPTSSGN